MIIDHAKALEDLPDADTNGIHDLLHDTKSYVKKIHWWIRLFGVIWLTGLAFSVLTGAYIVGRASIDANRARSTADKIETNGPADRGDHGGFSSKVDCIVASWTTADQCASWFPNG
jgi:hypothetical protein